MRTLMILFGLVFAYFPFEKNNNLGIPVEAKTIAEEMKKGGYTTSVIGKWHAGHRRRSFWPPHQGFDHSFIMSNADYWNYDVYKNGELYDRNLLKEGTQHIPTYEHSIPDPVYDTSELREQIWQVLPEKARPWVYWYWFHSNVTREGITKDLESMAQQGIGGAYLFSIGSENEKLIVEKPANPLTPYWLELIGHAFDEAERLGLKLALNACDGWATAGAPGITPEYSMQKLVWTETRIKGDSLFNGKLKQPETILDYYRDIAVLAIPMPIREPRSFSFRDARLSTSNSLVDIAGEDIRKGNIILESDGWLQLSFDEALTCRSITISASGRTFLNREGALQVSMDGRKWSEFIPLDPPFVGTTTGYMQGVSFSVGPVTGKYFRFYFAFSENDPAQWDLKFTTGWSPHLISNEKPYTRIRDIVISEAPVIEGWQHKNGSTWAQSNPVDTDASEDGHGIPFPRIVDLSDKMSPGGELVWKAPAGSEWIIQRFGYTTTGKTNHPASLGTGLEADKLSNRSVPVQFNSWFGKIHEMLQKNREVQVLTTNHTDSWECGSQNWSPVFREEFIRRCTYDPVKFLPAMTGVPIENPEISERFLFDIRQTIAELVCENFYDPLVELTHQSGALFSAEAMAPMMMSDGMAHFGRVDIPMGEFWMGPFQNKPNDIFDAIHGARIYGKNIVQAEAFTQSAINWAEDPLLLKAVGDYHFALGVNRFVLHVWTHKPDDRKPGVTLGLGRGGSYGTEFSRNQIWWKPGKAWFDYLTRCQALLQSGRPVVDLFYFVGENQPVRAFLPDNPAFVFPDGYTYNSINRDALLNKVTVKDGSMILPGGISSQLLVLPNSRYMTPEVAEKIAELSKNGVRVLGPKPDRSWSLKGYPGCDESVREIVRKGWGSVMESTALHQALKEISLLPDVVFNDVDLSLQWREPQQYKSPSFAWGHRIQDNADIYFLSNQEYREREVEIKFRVTGKIPELWDPGTGEIRVLTQWDVAKGQTSVPLRFGPAESYFIIFRKPGKPGNNLKKNFQEFQLIRSIDGPWEVRFQDGMGAPESILMDELESFHLNELPGVRFFSGQATYIREWVMEDILDENIFLDLGSVSNLAEVRLNGKDLGILWKPPFRINISGYLITGPNKLEVRVYNTWRNRIVGDDQLPKEERFTFLPMYPDGWKMNLPLVESGLSGPVNILKAVY